MRIVNTDFVPQKIRKTLSNFVDIQFRLYKDVGKIPDDIVTIDNYTLILDYDLLKKQVIVTGYWNVNDGANSAKVYRG